MSTETQDLIQATGLDVHETDDGLVVYDADRDRVHYLNETAAAIFVLAEPGTTVDSLAAELASLWGLDDAPTEEVGRGVAQLLAEGLLQSAPS